MKYILLSLFFVSSFLFNFAFSPFDGNVNVTNSMTINLDNMSSTDLKSIITEKSIELIFIGIFFSLVYALITRKKNKKLLIKFHVPYTSLVRIIMIDPQGKESRPLLINYYNPGVYTFKWDTSNYKNGLYRYRVSGEGTSQKFEKEMRVVLFNK